MKRDDTVYLHHILDANDRIESYLRGVTEEAFQANHLVQDGVIRQLGIIGEAIRQVSKSLRERYPMIAWQDIAGMRNKLIHDYLVLADKHILRDLILEFDGKLPLLDTVAGKFARIWREGREFNIAE